MSTTKQGDIVGFLEVANDGTEVTDKSTESFLILCPICGYEYNHFQETEPAEVKTRGGGIRLKFMCENGGHIWSIVIAHHKGQEYLATESIRGIVGDGEENPADRYVDSFYF